MATEMAISPARSRHPSRNTNESAEASAGIEPAMRVLQTHRPHSTLRVEKPSKFDEVARLG